MTLYFVGLGLFDEKDISVRGLEIVKKCDKIYLDNYTSILGCPLSTLESLYGKKITLASRDLVETNAEKTILHDARHSDVAFCVVGDIFSATTHVDLWLRASDAGIKTVLVNNASIHSAVAVTGLQVYKFGRTTSIPFPTDAWRPETPYEMLKQNKKLGMHTLVLLDLSPKEKHFMTVNEAISYLLSIEQQKQEQVFTEDTFCVGCARIGSADPTIKAGSAKELSSADFGSPLHCLVVPGELHFMEEEALSRWQKR